MNLTQRRKAQKETFQRSAGLRAVAALGGTNRMKPGGVLTLKSLENNRPSLALLIHLFDLLQYFPRVRQPLLF
jgi:hypothetical protein